MLMQWSGRPAQINRWVDNTLSPLTPSHPAVDVAEDADGFTIALEIPGVKAEEVKVALDGNRLTITGEKKQETEDRTDRVHRIERRFGSFRRAFTLPESVDLDQVAAKMADGVLTVTLRKTPRAKPRDIPVATR